jgi:hypothetical protein
MAGRPEIASHGVEGDALLVEVASALETLRRLLAHAWLRDAPEKSSLAGKIGEVDARLSRRDVTVLVAGLRGAGKTTFIDALFGDARLGRARGRGRATTFLRRGPDWDFVAVSGSRHERFSELVPDAGAELLAAIPAAQAKLAEAEAARAAARSAAGAADQVRSGAEAEGRSAFSALEGAREDAMGASQELAALEREAERTDRALALAERDVPPKVRSAAPWWAFWIWLLRLFFLWFRRAEWSRYLAGLRANELARARLHELRERATGTALAARQVESRLAAMGEDAAAARSAARDAQSALTRADHDSEHARSELEALQAELAARKEERARRFFTELAARCEGPAARATSIEIEGPALYLPDDILLLDAPALTEGSTEERARAWLVAADRADGCILLAELDRAVSEKAKRFLQDVRELVPHVLLVLTKMDKAYVAAVGRGGREPWEQVEQARRIGTRRFAREVGRAPDQVLSIAVAAQAALEDPDSGLATRFQTEVTKLFQLIRAERALIIGMRAASTLRRCIAGSADAEERAGRAYAARVATLEANRLPSPEEFRRTELARAVPDVERAAARAIRAATEAIDGPLGVVRAHLEQHFASARSSEEFRAAATRAEHELPDRLANVRDEVAGALEQEVDRAVREIEVRLFSHLRERYGLIHEIRRSQSSLPRLEARRDLVLADTAVVPDIERSLVTLSRMRWVLGIAGATVAAAVGTLLAPGLGTLVGAAVGSLLSLAPLRRRRLQTARQTIHRAISTGRARLVSELEDREADARDAIGAALDRSLGRAIERFGRMIAEPLEAEQEAIDREHRLRAELSELHGELQAHDERLGKLAKAATEESIGLCR